MIFIYFPSQNPLEEDGSQEMTQFHAFLENMEV